MGDFLAFRKMITPIVVQVLFWLGVIACVATGLAIMSGSSSLAGVYPISPKILGILVIVLGPLLVRFYCELIIVLFRIFDSLRVIERNTTPV
jgi:hypothetical protein